MAHTLPTLVSMLICDQVIDDKLTNKKSAIGIFNTILVPNCPFVIHQLTVLASLTELVAETEIELRFVRDAVNEVLFSGRGKVNAPDPLAVVDLVFSMQGISAPSVGQYAFELLSGGEILGRRRFQVIIPQQNRGDSGAGEH